MLFDELNMVPMESFSELSYNQLKNIKDKLHDFNKERIDLICKCIKSSIQIIAKLMKYFDKMQNTIINNDTLIQIKLVSKITRVMINNSNIEIKKSKNKKEKEFFTM